MQLHSDGQTEAGNKTTASKGQYSNEASRGPVLATSHRAMSPTRPSTELVPCHAGHAGHAHSEHSKKIA